MEMDPDEELQDAARLGDVALAEHALRQGARIHAVTTIGLRALHFAAQNGHDLLCELLLEEGADPNPKDQHGRTPIQLAAVRGHEATVELLKEHGAELTDELQEKMEAAVFKRQHRVQHIHSVHQGDVEAARAAQRRRERIERQRHHRKRLRNQQASITADEVDERDAKQVVDWWSAPQENIGQVTRMYALPTYVTVPDDRSNGTTTKRVPFDQADALVDESGWPKHVTRNGEKPSPYPVLCVSTPCTGKGMRADELGDIGGPGLRMYFFLLSFLCSAFFVMAVLSTPSVFLNSDDSMLNHSEAGRYRSAMAETTLGNVKIDLSTLASGEWFGHKLWTISTLESIGSLVMLAMVLRASGQMNKIAKEVDTSGCTMGDYTVMVSPTEEWSFYKGVGKNKQKQLIADVEETLEREISGSQIAEINGEPCIWAAWGPLHINPSRLSLVKTCLAAPRLLASDCLSPVRIVWEADDDDLITLWNQKAAELRKLEGALSDAYKGDAESTLKILDRLDEINAHIREMDKNTFTPVFVFATFQMSDHYEEAIARPEPVDIGGVQCQLLPAPEPETLVWEHLQVSADSRKRRKWCVIMLTAVALILGAVLILYANSLKAGVRYVDYCADVMGPEKIHQDVCPLPTELTTSAIVAADREGLSEPTVSNYRSKFIAVSDAAGSQFPQIDTEEIQQKLSLPICGAPAPNACDECQVDTNRYVTGEGFVRTNDCHYMDMGIHPDGPAEFLMRGGDIDAMCYACLCTLETVANERAAIEAWFAGDADEGYADPVVGQGGFCEPMERKTSSAALWGQLATVIVVVVNQVLKRGIRASASFGKAHTIEIEMASTALRVYVCQCLNTAILMLVINSNFCFKRTASFSCRFLSFAISFSSACFIFCSCLSDFCLHHRCF